MSKLYRSFLFLITLTMAAALTTACMDESALETDEPNLFADVDDDVVAQMSRPAPRSGQLYGELSARPGRGGIEQIAVINAVSSLVNTAADRYDAGAEGTLELITTLGASIYQEDASIFAALIDAGVLPPGQGPGFFAAALDGLAAGGQTLRVLRICDVIGLSYGDDAMSFVFSNIARRGPDGSPLLLEVERFDAVRADTGRWILERHDFFANEAEVESESCAQTEVQDALQAACDAAGVDCTAGRRAP